MQGSRLAHLVEPGGRVPDLVGRGEVFPHRFVVTDDDAELGGVEPGHDERAERLEGVAVLGAEQGAIRLLPFALADVVRARPRPRRTRGSGPSAAPWDCA